MFHVIILVVVEKSIANERVYSILFSRWYLIMGDAVVIYHLIKLHITIKRSYHATHWVG